MVKSAMDKKMMNTFNAQATAKLNSYVELLFLQRNDAIIDFKKMMRKNPKEELCRRTSAPRQLHM